MIPGDQLSDKEEVIQVLNDSTTFGFNEIRLNSRFGDLFQKDLNLKNTVELFSFGTFNDYLKYQQRFIELDSSGLYKLKQLTLISEALKSNSFRFDYLNQKVGHLSSQQFEKLIVDSIYSKIISGKIYSQEQIIEINSSIGRDVLFDNEVKPEFIDGEVKRISDLLKGLEKFNDKISIAFDYLKEVKSQVESKPTNKTQKKQGKEEKVDELKESKHKELTAESTTGSRAETADDAYELSSTPAMSGDSPDLENYKNNTRKRKITK